MHYLRIVQYFFTALTLSIHSSEFQNAWSLRLVQLNPRCPQEHWWSHCTINLWNTKHFSWKHPTLTKINWCPYSAQHQCKVHQKQREVSITFYCHANSDHEGIFCLLHSLKLHKKEKCNFSFSSRVSRIATFNYWGDTCNLYSEPHHWDENNSICNLYSA